MYMRLFSGDEAERVGVFVIKSGKFIRAAPVKGQLAQDYFYGKHKRTEKAFGPIEGRAATIFANAIEHHRLPGPDSEEHEGLTFYLGIQHSRTVGAAEQHNEGAEKTIKAMLRRQAELEGNTTILESLDKVRIRRKNAVSEVVGYATVGASLLADLSFALVGNESDVPFISSDTPVVLHILGKVLVARRIEQVEQDPPALEGHDRAGDGDAALLLDRHPVRAGATAVAARAHLAGFADRAGSLE